MAPPSRDAWLARGACARCGRPVARRAEGPGRVAATCNVCRATTPLRARRVRLEPGRPPQPWLSARGRWVLPALTLAVVVLLAGAVAWRQLDAEPAPDEPPAPGPATEEVAWARLEQRIVPEFGETETRFRVEVDAYDRNGTRLSSNATGVGEWLVAQAPGLVASPDRLSGWTRCAPQDCDLRVPAGGFAYFDGEGIGAEGTGAFDTGRRELYVWGGGAWQPVEDWESWFRGFVRTRAAS